MAIVANVAFTDPIEVWRGKTNQTIKIVNDIELGVHPLANTVRAAANTANSVSNSAANIAYTLVTGNTAFMGQITDSANNLISTVYTNIYQDSNASFLRSNAALLTANTAMIIANSAFATANNFVANSANIVANVILQNTSTQNTLNAAATSYVQSYLANVSFSTIFNTANSAFIKANTANSLASIAYDQANTARSTANTIFNTANAAFDVANTGGGATAIATAAFAAANTGVADAGTAFSAASAGLAASGAAFNAANGSFSRVNTVFSIANTAFIQANTAFGAANTANTIAVAAFTKANTSSGGANVAIINDTTTDTNFFITMTRQSTGNASNLGVSTSQLYFNPATGALNSTIFNSLSDENAKEKVERIENALDLIEKLNGVSFEFKDSHEKSSGIIAQNLINVMPYLVRDTVRDNKMELTVNYNGLSALFIEAIKELNKEVKALKDKLGQ